KAWLDQGWCKWLDDQVGESARAFGRALELLPVGTDAALARFKLADAQFRQGDLTNALQNYRAMIKGYATWPRVQERWLDQALYQTVRVGLALPSKAVAQEALRQLLRDFPGRPLTERAMLLA